MTVASLDCWLFQVRAELLFSLASSSLSCSSVDSSSMGRFSCSNEDFASSSSIFTTLHMTS